jgi:hypothetical protein
VTRTCYGITKKQGLRMSQSMKRLLHPCACRRTRQHTRLQTAQRNGCINTHVGQLCISNCHDFNIPIQSRHTKGTGTHDISKPEHKSMPTWLVSREGSNKTDEKFSQTACKHIFNVRRACSVPIDSAFTGVRSGGGTGGWPLPAKVLNISNTKTPPKRFR